MAIHGHHGIATRIMRRQSHSSLSIGLTIDRLCRFLCHALPRHTKDRELKEMAASAYEQFATLNPEGFSPNREELSQVDDVLAAFVTSSRELPATIVFEVHSLRGLVQEATGQHSEATKSYMKALWIAAGASQEIPQGATCVDDASLGQMLRSRW